MENVTPYPHKSPIQFVHLYILECVPRIYCFLHGENARSQVECVVNNLKRKFSDLRLTLGFKPQCYYIIPISECYWSEVYSHL